MTRVGLGHGKLSGCRGLYSQGSQRHDDAEHAKTSTARRSTELPGRASFRHKDLTSTGLVAASRQNQPYGHCWPRSRREARRSVLSPVPLLPDHTRSLPPLPVQRQPPAVGYVLLPCRAPRWVDVEPLWAQPHGRAAGCRRPAHTGRSRVSGLVWQYAVPARHRFGLKPTRRKRAARCNWCGSVFILDLGLPISTRTTHPPTPPRRRGMPPPPARSAPWFYRRRVRQGERLVHQCVHLR